MLSWLTSAHRFPSAFQLAGLQRSLEDGTATSLQHDTLKSPSHHGFLAIISLWWVTGKQHASHHDMRRVLGDAEIHRAWKQIRRGRGRVS